MPRGAQPGERRGGRSKGTPNKATAEVKALAQEHGPKAIKKLAHLMENADSDAAKIAACRELLDRAYGKSAQPLSNDNDEPLKVINEIVLRGVRPFADNRNP